MQKIVVFLEKNKISFINQQDTPRKKIRYTESFSLIFSF
ncbi:hypothetical protein CUO_0171 [Enterococcus faecium PC4.1]|nr:hypothetical protein CUO_0171 [Enterococcus faecium PC4.1]